MFHVFLQKLTLKIMESRAATISRDDGVDDNDDNNEDDDDANDDDN